MNQSSTCPETTQIWSALTKLMTSTLLMQRAFRPNLPDDPESVKLLSRSHGALLQVEGKIAAATVRAIQTTMTETPLTEQHFQIPPDVAAAAARWAVAQAAEDAAQDELTRKTTSKLVSLSQLVAALGGAGEDGMLRHIPTADDVLVVEVAKHRPGYECQLARAHYLSAPPGMLQRVGPIPEEEAPY